MEAGSTILTPKQNGKSMEWHHAASATKKKKKKTKPIPTAGRIMRTVLWDVYVDFLLRWETVSEICFIQVLHNKCPNKRHIILQHKNVHPDTACLTLGRTEKFGWAVLPHPLHSSDGSFGLSPVWALKRSHEGQHYENEAVQLIMHTWL
jgi:hypothetical protein